MEADYFTNSNQYNGYGGGNRKLSIRCHLPRYEEPDVQQHACLIPSNLRSISLHNNTPNRSAIRYGILYVCIRGRIVVIIKHMFTYIHIFMYTRLKEKHFEIDLLCSCMHETIYRPLMILYRKRSTIEVMNMLEGLHTMHS